MKKLLKFIGVDLLILLIVFLFASRGWLTGTQKGLQNYFYSSDQASSDIVIVGIDEDTLSTLGNLGQWERKVYADAIDNLKNEGVSTIGVDVTFPNPSVHGAEDDAAFANALDKNTVLASHYVFDSNGRQYEYPNSTLKNSDAKLGWINVQQDSDGFVRRLPVYTEDDKKREAFSLEVARQHLGLPNGSHRVNDGLYDFGPGYKIPVITHQDKATKEDIHLMHINYFAAPKKYTQLSFVDALEGKYQDARGNPIDLKDKIVLIGPTAVDLQDLYLSPVSFGVNMAGVEIHANNIQTILERKFLQNQSVGSLWLTIAGVIAINTLLFSRLRVIAAMMLFIAQIFGLLFAGFFLYEYGVIFNVIYPTLALIITFINVYLLRFILEQKDRRFIEGAFGHYVNESLVKQIIKDPKSLELGGEKKEITILFSDIASFTSLSEQMDPQELVGFLNEYLEEMTSIVLEHEGTLDKYEGDAIMAFWNAPLSVEGHAKKTCEAALKMQQKMQELRDKWKAESKPEMHMRIGLNTGEAVAGNMGSKDRFDYTVMGDNVNLASRLESINKQYGTELMISEMTYAAIKDDFVCRELDMIRVKGKNEPVRVYELMATHAGATAEQKALKEQFETALAQYRAKNFEAAKAAFEALNDPAANVFAQRCMEFIQNSPAEGWDGVYTFTTK